jgi:hypothetical protein
MKTLDWIRFLESQQRLHSKTLYTVTELANVANVSLNSINVEAGRLVKKGIIVRYANGRYGLPGAVTAETLLPTLDPRAYISGPYALYRHGIVTQAQTEICCMTDRRHNRSRTRTTPIGRFVFVCTRQPIYAPPADGSAMASPEQALCDYVYLLGRRRLDPSSLVTFRGMDRLDAAELAGIAARYPSTVARAVERIVG